MLIREQWKQVPLSDIAAFIESETHSEVVEMLIREQWKLVPLSDIAAFIESETHSEVVEMLISEQWKQHVAEWKREDVFKIQCHAAVLLTLLTGKRPGVICEMRLQDITNAVKGNYKQSVETCWKLTTVQECQLQFQDSFSQLQEDQYWKLTTENAK